MKHGIFISYSDLDREKIKLFEREIKKSNNFQPIIIAFDRQALTPLAQKVADGIIKSEIVVPILTANSISTQWINQEIGFATALNKKILPIVDKSLINDLKGFIHKQIDLPYGFNTSTKRATENKDFVKQVRTLLSDLDKEFNTLVSEDEPTEKTDFEKSLEQVDSVNEEINFQNHRKFFLNSVEGTKLANSEVIKMFDEIEYRMSKLSEKQFLCGSEKSLQRPPTFIVRCDGYSFNIEWHQDYNFVFEGASLIVRFWNGPYSLDSPGRYPPNERPQQINAKKYIFDIDKHNNIFWNDVQNKKLITSSQIIDSGFKWLIDQVSNKRKKQYSS